MKVLSELLSDPYMAAGITCMVVGYGGAFLLIAQGWCR